MENDQAPHTSASAPGAAADSPSQPYYDEAWAMICTGERPSAEKLVARLGGSKTTAVTALRVFWATELPKRMQAQHVVAPTKIHEIAARLWTEAQKLARDEAELGFSAERAELVVQRRSLEEQVRQRAAHDQAHAAQLAAVTAQAHHLAGAEQQLRSHVATLEASLADLRDQRDRLRTTLTSLEDMVTAKEAGLSELRSRNEIALGALQSAEADAAALRLQVTDVHSKLARIPELERELGQAKANADKVVAEVSASMADQHKAALDAVKESHQKVVDNLLLQVDAARTETARVRESGAASEKALRQRISRLENAPSAKTQPASRKTAKPAPG